MTIKHLLIKIPRRIKVLWGRVLIYMLGQSGDFEFYADMILYNKLRRWIDENKTNHDTNRNN